MEQESLGVRFKRFVTLLGMVTVISLVIVVTERLSDDALALLVGLAAGIAAMTPALLLLGVLWRRHELRLQERLTAPQWGTPSPPVIVVAPPMLPGYGEQRQESWKANALWTTGPVERKFTVVGGEQ